MLLVMFVIFILLVTGIFYKTGKVPNEPLLLSFVVFFLYFFMSDPGSVLSRLLMVVCIFVSAVFFLQFLGIGAGALKLVMVISLVLGWKLSLLFLLILSLFVLVQNANMRKKGKRSFRYFPLMVSVIAVCIFILGYTQEWL